MPTRTRPPPIDRTGKRSERMRQVWLAYREKFGLAKKRTLTDDEIEHALDGVDIDAMHDEVRAIRRKNMPRVPASRPDEWPFHISSTEKRGVIYTRNEYGAIQRYATPRTPRDGAEQ